MIAVNLKRQHCLLNVAKGAFKIYRWVLLVPFVCVGLTAGAQYARRGEKAGTPVVEKGVSQIIKKTYPASVLMWEFDAPTQERRSAQFSGVVVTADGIILSAAHVVMPNKTYKVMFPDGRECIALGLGRIAIPPSFISPDAAMLKIVANGSWPYAEMGWSSLLKIGDPCISIAYPETLAMRQPTVRIGNVTRLTNQWGLMRSTCVMEPGDSGGPLFDTLGRVIGIRSGIENSEDVNYDIPIDVFRKYWSALMLAKNYRVLPADTNSINAEHSALNGPNTPGLSSVGDAKALAGALSSCLIVESTVGGISQKINGTSFSFKGLHLKPGYAGKSIIISKSSMVGDDPILLLANNQTCKAVVVKRDKKNDIVLLVAAEKAGIGIASGSLNTDTVMFDDLGKVLISALPDSHSITGHIGSIPFNLPKRTSYGYLGAAVEVHDDKAVFSLVQPNSAADLAGIQVGDEFNAINQHSVTAPEDFYREMNQYMACDTVSIAINRFGQTMNKMVVLKYPPQNVTDHPAENFDGGKSIRRDGFDHVFVHDARLKASECGGPVFDQYGRFYGVNIARQSRTSCIVLSVAAIKQALTSVLVFHKDGK